MKIIEKIKQTLARVDLKKVNSTEVEKEESIRKLEEDVSMKKEDYVPKIFIDYKNEKEGSIIKKLNIDSFMKTGENIEEDLSFLVSMLLTHIEQLRENQIGLNLDSLVSRSVNIKKLIKRHNQDLNRLLLGWEEEMTIKENKIIELEDQIRKLEAEVAYHKNLSAANSMSNLKAMESLSTLQIESKNDSNAEVLALAEEVRSLKELIAPSLPAIQQSQKMMHSNKSGDNNPNSRYPEDELIRLVKIEGKSAKECADLLGVSVQAIYKRAKSLGLNFKKNK